MRDLMQCLWVLHKLRYAITYISFTYRVNYFDSYLIQISNREQAMFFI